jgi:hypothetical protein
MRRADLIADCGSCAALCCVATSFEASDDFAFDKPAGVRCRHLTRADRCGVYARRDALGCSGCAGYDCYGAGQRVTRAYPSEHERNAAFLIARVIHELLWLLTEAQKLCPRSQPELFAELTREIATLDVVVASPGSALLAVDSRPLHDRAHTLLRRVGSAVGGRATLRTLP